MMFWFHEELHCRCVGFEKDLEVFKRTELALQSRHCPAQLYQVDYEDGLRWLASQGQIPEDALLIFVLDPPWGEVSSPFLSYRSLALIL